MAVVSILDAFGYKWAQTGAVEALTDDQWKAGWAFIGALPPSVEQFNKWGQVSDEKSNYLYAQMKAVFDAAGEVPDAADLNSLRDAMLGLVGGGRLLRRSVYRIVGGVQQVSINGAAFTATGASTFTALAAAASTMGWAQGAGGGGGGAATTGVSQVAAAEAGRGGAYGVGFYTSGFSGGLPITVGVGGVGGAAGNNNGAAGGASSIGTLLTSPGGNGGVGGPANALGDVSVVDSAPSSAPTGANVLSMVGAGAGFRFLTATGQFVGSRGGAAGDGSPGPAMQNNGAGPSALNTGAGGSGATLGSSLAAAAGGTGGSGYVIIEERA